MRGLNKAKNRVSVAVPPSLRDIIHDGHQTRMWLPGQGCVKGSHKLARCAGIFVIKFLDGILHMLQVASWFLCVLAFTIASPMHKECEGSTKEFLSLIWSTSYSSSALTMTGSGGGGLLPLTSFP